MLPSETSDRVPKSVLRYLWSVKVLKAGLGMTDENQVRAFFHEHPYLLNTFEQLNRHFEFKVNAMQRECIVALQAFMAQRNNVMPDLNQPRIEEMKVEEDL